MDNQERSAQEVATFRTSAPDVYFAYQFGATNFGGRPAMGRKIGTWMGDELANVKSTGCPYTSNMGDWRQSFRAVGINGVEYAGIAYLGAGDYVRMRKVKQS